MKSVTLKLDRHTLRVSLEMITPENAECYLGKSKHNRNLRAALVSKYAREILAGYWVLNGAPIVFDSNGDLVDGQHRLQAIVETGKALVSIVIRGVAPVRAQQTIDAGSKRTFGQQLTLLGEANAGMLASAIASIYRLTVLRQESRREYPTILEGLKILEDHPGIRDSLQWGHRANRCEIRFSAGQATALNFLFRTIDHKDADLFFDRLCNGTDLVSDDPIFVLRRLLIRARQIPPSRQSGYTLSVPYRGAITIKAWLRWRAGEKIKNLRWQGGGANPEPFPQFDDEIA